MGMRLLQRRFLIGFQTEVAQPRPQRLRLRSQRQTQEITHQSSRDGAATVTTNEDTDKTFSHTDFNFSDVDSGDALAAITITGLPTDGKIFVDNTELTSTNLASLGADISKADIDAGKVRFRPDADENGTGYATFTYTVSDGTASSGAATMTVNVTPVNDAPVVSAITATKTENDSSFVTNLTAGQTDPDGDTLSVSGTPTITAVDGNGTSYTLPANTASVSGNNLTVDPTKLNGLDDGESVVITVTYDVSDGTATTQNTAAITVTGVNDAPVVSAITATKTENDSSFVTNLTAGQTDPDGDTLSVSGTPTITAVDGNGTSYTLPANTASVSGNNLTVDPTKLNGLDDGESVVITVTYDVSDGTATTQNTAAITVTGVNDAPVVSAITATKTENDSSFVTNLTAGQTDPDGDTLSVSGTPTITAVDGNGTSYTLPANTASVSGNNLTVDPTKLNGLDDGESVVITVTYDVSDGTATTQNTAAITVTGVNDAPVVSAITATKTENDSSFVTNLTAGQTDPDGDTLSVSGTPTITAVDGNGTSYTLPANTASVSGNNLTVDPTKLNGLDDGESVVITVTYDVSDGTATTQNTAAITVTGVNDAPVVSAITATKTENDSSFVTNLTAGQTDPDGDTLSVSGTPTITAVDGNGTSYTLPANTASVSGNNLTVDPTKLNGLDDGESVVITVTYDVSDGTATTQNTAAITVTGVNDAPVVSAITATKTENDSSFVTNLTAGQTDPDGDTLSVSGTPTITAVDGNGTSYTLPANTASVSGNNLTVDPTKLNGLDDGESVVITVTYDVSDGTATTQNTAAITVTGVNDAPVVSAITATKTENDSSFVTNLTAGQTDPDGDTLSVSGTPTITAVDGNGTSYTLPANTASVSGNNLTVDPTKLNGLDDGESVVITVTYDVSDGTATTQNTAAITVTGVNDAPVVSAITATKTENDSSFVTNLTAGQTDPDGDTLSVSGTPTITAVDGNGTSYTLPANTASVSGNNLTVDPTKLNGLDDGESVVITVTYDVSDGTATTQNTAAITVTWR
jgi:uncharacterized lipoprotein